MKKIKSFAVIIISIVLCLCVTSGCGRNQTGPVPNGEYFLIDADRDCFSVLYKDKEIWFDSFWRIAGSKATFYLSGSGKFKCNITEEDGKIYFEGYKWFDILSMGNVGKEFKLEVQYDEETESIVVPMNLLGV